MRGFLAAYPSHSARLQAAAWEAGRLINFTDIADPYDNKYIISFRDFVRDPMVHDLIHNGHTFQVSRSCHAP